MVPWLLPVFDSGFGEMTVRSSDLDLLGELPLHPQPWKFRQIRWEFLFYWLELESRCASR